MRASRSARVRARRSSRRPRRAAPRSSSPARRVTTITWPPWLPAAVRRACRCAACVDERTGRPRLDPASVSEAIAPTSVAEQGNYAVAITWSDGHASGIFTYAQLGELAAVHEAAARKG